MLEIRKVIENIEKVIPSERVLVDEVMSKHTSFKIGGPAAALVLVNNEKELSQVLQIVGDSEHLLIGNGSNFLVADEGYPGIMIKLDGDFDSIENLGEGRIKVGASKLLSNVSNYLVSNGLAGFEFASGIPGSIGGAMFMNAGAYGGEMKDIVETVRLMKPDGTDIFERNNSEMKFGYRHSSIQEDGSIVLSVVFKFESDDTETIKARVAELQQKRNSKQPVNYPSAGSTFKRPVGGYAAALIDQAGLRGFSVGGAQVSEKHTGFVINTGNATARDVVLLMTQIRDTVYSKFGIMLEPEVRLINCGLYHITKDFHTHTIYSKVGPYLHGKGQIIDNVAAAHAKGLKEIAITDHGPLEIYGLDPAKLDTMREEIKASQEKYPDVKVYLGVEANIMDSKNGLDVEPKDFSKYDFVNAGYHYGVPHCGMITNWIAFHLPCSEAFKEKMRKKNTDLAVRAIKNNKIKILTHPGDKAYFDMQALAKACEETGTLVEINARHKNPDVDDLKMFAKYGVKFIISSDAHKPEKVGRYIKSLELAFAAGIGVDRIVNIEEG